jgi:hypothetical protein
MDKLKEMLSKILQPEDMAKFESLLTESISTAVAAAVTAKEKEIKDKYDLLSEEYCKGKIEEGIATAREQIILEYDEKMVQLSNKADQQLDLFLEQEIIPQVTDQTIGKIALNEALMPIVTGMKTLLESHGISIDTTGSSILKEARDEIVRLTEENDKAIKNQMVLNEQLEASAKFILLQEKIENLKPEQKKRTLQMFESKGFDETEDKIDSFVKFLIENEGQPNDAAAAAAAGKGVGDAGGSGTDPKTLLENEDPLKKKDPPKKEPVLITDTKVIDQAMVEVAGNLID